MFDAKSILEGIVRGALPQQSGANTPSGGLTDILGDILKGGGTSSGQPGYQPQQGGGGLADILGELQRQLTQGGAGNSAPNAPRQAMPGSSDAGLPGGLGDIFGQMKDKLGQAGGALTGNQSGSITDILGQIFTQATSGTLEGAGRIGQATGASDATREAIRNATGKSPEELLEQLKGMIQNNPFAAGTAAGGLGGLVLGTRAGRSLAGTAARLGALALIGGLAYKAYQNYQTGKPLITGAVPAEEAPRGSGFEPGAVTNDQAAHYIEAMVAAAAADGRVDASEQQRIIGSLQQAGLDAEAEAFLANALNTPKTAEELANLAGSPEEALQIYTAARIAIDPDQSAEQQFLNRLASSLGIDRNLAAHVDASARSAAA